MAIKTKTEISRTSGEPSALYARVKQMIIGRIRSGEWAANCRIPSENELVRELDVSRMTINRALRELSIEGILVRIQGVGTFVAEAKSHSELVEVRNIADEIAERGHDHHAIVTLLQEEMAKPDISYGLNIVLMSPVFHSIIVHHENGTPVQLEDRFVNPATAPNYLEQDFTRITPNAFLMQVAPLSEVEHKVEAVLPAEWESRLLAVTSAEPCLLIKRRTWSGNLFVTTTRLLHPGSRYRLQGRHSNNLPTS